MAEDVTARRQTGRIEWASAARAFDDAPVSGDRQIVANRPGGLLLAVIDGLGHGTNAAAAAAAAAAAIEGHAAEAPDQILRRCHLASTATRGSAITIVAIDLAAERLAWAGVGNVAGVVLSVGPPQTGKLIRGHAGIVGSHLPKLHTETLQLHDGDVVLLASDGIRPDFGGVTMLRRPLQRIVDEILVGQAVPNDDALVVAARYHRART
jgi:phosphoserine phosphatase RsbX